MGFGGKEVGAVSEFSDRFVQGLAGVLRRASLPRRLRREIDLEHALWPAVRAYTKRALNMSEEELDKALVTHGRTREEKERWTHSKPRQNVIVYGHPSTSDIFLQDKRVKSVYVELKLAKARSRNASTLPGDLQRSLGQSLLAHLRHKYVVCCIVCQRRVAYDKNARRLERMLWRKHRIATVVRSAQLGRRTGPKLANLILS
jgi:hypothetical protein